MTDLCVRARDYATYAHVLINHKRKYTGQPYQVHLKSVVQILQQVVDPDPAMIAAAWLHDTVEDTEATHHQIEAEFGADVAELVYQLTDISRPGDGNRAHRKAMDRVHLAEASSRAKTIKLADLIDNTRDICRHDEKFARVYVQEVSALLGVLQGGDERLYKQAQKTLSKCCDKLGVELSSGSMLHLDARVQRQQVAFSQRRAMAVFSEAFSARDIAEPLRSYDHEAVAAGIISVLDEHALGVVGIRDQGFVSGYARRDDLNPDRSAGAVARAFANGQVLAADAALNDVVTVLTRYEYCFVSVMDGIAAVISRKDIEKPVVRMWLFGLITTLEINMGELIRANLGEDWQQFCSKARLNKARTLQVERLRLSPQVDLLDCLQLTDKARILFQAAENLEQYGFSSKSMADKLSRELEYLRNHLAHGQPIAEENWPQIVRLANNLERVVNHSLAEPMHEYE